MPVLDHMLLHRRRWLAFVAALGASGSAFSQTSSGQPIRLVIPFSAGGVLDSLARSLARRLGMALGQSVIVDNRPGAGGNIGTEFVARSTPDGNTLVISGITLLSTALLTPDQSFSPLRDLAPVAMLATTPGIIVAYRGAPYSTIAEMVAYAKANPGKLSFASAGNGSTGHLIGAWINSTVGIDMVHVPYKGGSAASIDVIAGRVPLWIDVASNREMISAGKVKPLAVTSRQRTPLLPDVPTLIESGLPIEAITWWALMAPKATPPKVVDRLSSDLSKIIASPEEREEIARLSIDPDYRGPAPLATFMAAEMEKWRRVIKDADIKVGE
jgi:tripartite-type tricarboxylate transporter receptor subunit TctC